MHNLLTFFKIFLNYPPRLNRQQLPYIKYSVQFRKDARPLRTGKSDVLRLHLLGYTISSVNISCNIPYIVVKAARKKAPIYEIGAIPGKNHPCSSFGRCLKLSIRENPVSSRSVFPREIFKSVRGRAGDRMPTKPVKSAKAGSTVKKVAAKKVAAKKPATKVKAKTKKK